MVELPKEVAALRAVWNELNLTTAKPAAIEWAQRMAQAIDAVAVAAGVPTSSVTRPGEWEEAERIRDLPAVDEAILNFKDDCTGDNATCIVRAVMRACGVEAAAPTDDDMRRLAARIATTAKVIQQVRGCSEREAVQRAIEAMEPYEPPAAGVKGAPLVPCPVCGGEAVHAQDLLERTVIQPCDVPPGKWKVDMPDGLYTQMPGDPPGPADLRKIIGGYVYEVQPHSGKLVAAHPPTGFRLQKFSEDMQRRNAGVGGPEHG